MDRVQLIERSLQCDSAGWWSLVPLAGLLPAMVAFYLYVRVQSESGAAWNPAAGYLRRGYLLALVGSGVSLLLVGLVAVRGLM